MEHTRLIDHIQTAVAVVDQNMFIVDANYAYSHRLNKDGEDVIGKKCFKSACHFKEMCSKCLSSPCPIETSFMTKQKSSQVHHYWVEGQAVVEEITSTPIIEKNGAVDFVIEEFRDLSDLLGLNKGIISTCSYCRKIRDVDGTWLTFEDYLQKHTGALFSHGICGECTDKVLEEEFNKPLFDQS